jgi:hypothetical protein
MGNGQLHQGFHHVAIHTDDWDSTIGCYVGLGYTSAVTWGQAPYRAAMLDAGDGTYMEVFERPEGTEKPGENLDHFCLRTDDVDAAHAQAIAMGMKEIAAPSNATTSTTSGHGEVPLRLSFVEGPTGEVIEFLHGMPPEPPA